VLLITMDISPAENEPTAEAIESLDEEKLLEWIQKKLPSLRRTDNNDRFLKSRINGHVFLMGAGNEDFFMEAGLPFRPSVELAELAQNVIGKKSKCYSLFHPRHTEGQLTTSQGTLHC
jgi:hypothetical protein